MYLSQRISNEADAFASYQKAFKQQNTGSAKRVFADDKVTIYQIRDGEEKVVSHLRVYPADSGSEALTRINNGSA